MNRRTLRWFALALGALVASGCAESGPAVVATDTGPVRGHRLYQAKCSMCHELVDPGAFTKQEWPRLLEKYGQRARLKPDDERSILAYLEEAAR